MSKFEFITETDFTTGRVLYYTEKDGKYVDSTICVDKNSAYEKFIKAASGVCLKPTKEVTETIFSTTE